MKIEHLDINGTKYLLKIFYESRTNSTASVRRNNIILRMPLSLSREEQWREVRRLRTWALQKIKQNPEKYKPKAAREYKNGEILHVGNEVYTLKIDFKEKQSSSARLIENVISLVISSSLSLEQQQKHVSSLLSRIIARKRITHLKEKINAINNSHFHQEIKKIFFKNNKSNWGSCSEHGNINISTRLLFAPDDVLEYVCIHELAHRIEFNHTEKFWSLVEKAMPAYREKEQWLKENGDKCFF